MTTRALVLSGGGPVGIAWESGLIAGFAEGGVDLGAADFILGTSAGSFVGAKLALGAEARTLAEPILKEAERAASGGGGGRPPADLSKLLAMMTAAQGGLGNPAEARAGIGAFALGAETISEEEFIASFGKSFANLPRFAWPERDFACTAVDAEDGSFRLWTKSAGVGVTRAVASSCSVPGIYPPVTLGERRYIDGGLRSPSNADMAAGYDVVVVVSVRGPGSGPMADGAAARLDEEVESLKEGGSTVVVVAPDEASLAAFGPNLMDFRRRPDAARAGVAQGREQAEVLKGFWVG